MNRQRYFVMILALLLILLSWWGIATAQNKITVHAFEKSGVPMLYIAPKKAEKIPGVLVAHGFAGSKQLMLGYAQVLAHSGYAVMLWDFNGHGANSQPLKQDSLQENLQEAYTALIQQPEVDPTRIALLGHSMGSGAVMSAAINNLERYAATVAISPTGANVTPSAPRNLQLQVGSGEERFINNAQRLLKQAGGEGKERAFVIIPNVEHITILFSNASHQAALKWLNSTFGIETNSRYIDHRMIWYGLHLLGWLLMLTAIKFIFTISNYTSKLTVHPLIKWGGLLFAPFVATGIISLLSRSGEIQNLGGLLVGGAIAIWFFVAGITWLGIIAKIPRPTFKSLGLGVILFILLWVGFGAMAQVVWLQWRLIPIRLQLVPLLSLGCLPWFLASGIVQQDTGIIKRFFWWLGQSVAVVAGFWLTVYFVNQLSFIFILLPLFPIFIAMFSFAAAQLKDVWSYALGCAIFFGWVLAAAFPLA